MARQESKRSTPRKLSSWGPPRKAEHRTGTNARYAIAVASALPGVTSSRRAGRTSFSVDGTRFAVVGDATVVADREHELGRVGRDELRAAIEDAWEAVAPKRAVTTYRKQRARREALPEVTHDDIRRIVAAFPGANEGPIWGSDVGFRVGDEKKTRFARFGPPVGGGVGNLLPPDDEGTLVILRCPSKPVVLAAHADRFFTTPHYGPADEPGGIITRLCEHRGPDDLATLAELLEDAYEDAIG